MNKVMWLRRKHPLRELDLTGAAKIYMIYLHALGVQYVPRQAHARTLRNILEFYGKDFPLKDMTGACVLRYADLYDPYSDNPYINERGRLFWKFIHWLKKNQMIPAWTDPE